MEVLERKHLRLHDVCFRCGGASLEMQMRRILKYIQRGFSFHVDETVGEMQEDIFGQSKTEPLDAMNCADDVSVFSSCGSRKTQIVLRSERVQAVFLQIIGFTISGWNVKEVVRQTGALCILHWAVCRFPVF